MNWQIVIIVWLYVVGGWSVVEAGCKIAPDKFTKTHKVLAFFFWPFFATWVMVFG
jgi:hypothetical protein